MEITLVKSPEMIEGKVQIQWDRLSENTAHALIAELYRADCITFRQAQALLNCTSWQETADILENQGCELYYDRDDFEDDLDWLYLEKALSATQ
jgi:predicted HTH domain antitoxin